MSLRIYNTLSRELEVFTPLEPGHVRVYSDHASDAPVFAIADEAFLVGRGAKSERIAAAHGWHIVDFRVNSTPTDVDDQRISSA